MAIDRILCRRTVVLLATALTLAVPMAAGAGAVTTSPRTVTFSGFSWAVKASTGTVGPGPNYFSDRPENVWVDSAGQLHLAITSQAGQWRAAEVMLDRSLGYGTYRFTLASSVGRLDPSVVLGLFTWSDKAAYHHREIDIEVARWGSATAASNAQYGVQPSSHAGNFTSFVQPDEALTIQEFTWTRKSVSFRTLTAAGATIASWSYSGPDVPRSGDERPHINLWLDRGTPPTNGAGVEVVLSGFSFTPR